MKLELYLERHKEWSLSTFGPGRRTLGVTRHIEKEIAEVRAAPLDLTEWVDIIILALDGAWRAGHSVAEICEALQLVQQRNFQRTYPKPTSDDDVSEHIRTA